MAQRLGWVRAGRAVVVGRDWAIEAKQMSQVLTMDLLVTRALVHQEKRLELMCFAPLTRNILTLWASSGQLMALGLENKDATRKPRCRPVCGRLCPLLSRQAPFVHGAFWVRPADSALATGLCPQLTVLRPPSPHPARLLGGLTSGASGSLPTPEAPQVPTQAQLIPPLFSETPAGLGGRWRLSAQARVSWTRVRTLSLPPW